YLRKKGLPATANSIFKLSNYQISLHHKTMIMQKPYPKEVWLNGQWLPHDQATVSVFDRGFMLGDGVYEVVPCYYNSPFTLQEHLLRLQSGLNEVGIAFDAMALQDRISEAIIKAAWPDGDGAIY